MSDITVTAAKVAVVQPHGAEIFDLEAAEAITAGQVVYMTTAGKAGLADGSAAGTVVCPGIALNAAGAGGGVSVLKRGYVGGFTVSSLNCGAKLYISDTAGALADAAGSNSKVVGIVGAMPEVGGPVKLLYVDAAWS